MTRSIPRPLPTVALATAVVLAGTYLSLSFGQQGPGSAPRPSDGPVSPPGAALGFPGRVTWQYRGGKADSLAERVAAQDAETREQIETYRRTQDNDEKLRIAKALPDLVGKQFDARQEVREQELKQLEEQVSKLRELHVRRAKQREQIVEERVRQLLRDADGLGWGSDEEQSANLFDYRGVPGAPGARRP